LRRGHRSYVLHSDRIGVASLTTQLRTRNIQRLDQPESFETCKRDQRARPALVKYGRLKQNRVTDDPRG
jgi:hypothetical protein